MKRYELDNPAVISCRSWRWSAREPSSYDLGYRLCAGRDGWKRVALDARFISRLYIESDIEIMKCGEIPRERLQGVIELGLLSAVEHSLRASVSLSADAGRG